MEIHQLAEVMEDARQSISRYSEFNDCLDHLTKGINLVHRPLRILVMGEFSTGKSTFIDAFLGKEILVKDVLPTTAILTKITYGTKHTITIHYKDGKTRVLQDDLELRQVTAEDESGNVKQSIRSEIDYVEIAEPIEILKQIEFIDSPGLDADNEAHAAITDTHKNDADVIFWVINIQHAGRNTEFQEIQSLPERLKPFIILNQIDIVDEDEQIDTVVETVRRNLKHSIRGIFPVSSQDALDGKLERDAELVEDSRFTALEDYVQHTLIPESGTLKFKSVLSELTNGVASLGMQLQVQEDEAASYRTTDYQQFIEKRAFISSIKQSVFQPLHKIMPLVETMRNSGDAVAQKLLGLSYYFGLGNGEEPEKGIEILEVLTQKDDVTLTILWQYYAKRKNWDIAVTWAEKLASTYNRADAITFLADVYGDKHGTVYNISQAVHWSKIASDLGVGTAQLAYALYCYKGTGIAKNYEVAFAYFKEADKRNTKGAAYWLGQCYELGNGVGHNDAVAFDWYKKAVAEHDIRANKPLGLCYKQGKGTTQDYAQAITYLKPLLTTDASIAFDLGECYFKYGESLYQQKKYDEAIVQLTEACNLKYPYASRTLADVYIQYGQAQSVEKQIKCYEKALALGNDAVKGKLGLLYAKGPRNIADINKAIPLCIEAANAGDTSVMTWLANQYENGHKVVKDNKKARYYYLEAAKAGDKDALQWTAWQFYRGTNGFPKDYEKAATFFKESNHIPDTKVYYEITMYVADKYFYGRNVAINYAKAFEWYKEAADYGNAEAMNKVGYCYDHGKGVTSNAKGAFKYFHQAAEKGLAIAQANLGLYYAGGLGGVPKNTTLAFQWYEKAANQGEGNGQCALGECYLKGIGIKENLNLASEWLQKAIEKDIPKSFELMGDCIQKQYEELSSKVILRNIIIVQIICMISSLLLAYLGESLEGPIFFICSNILILYFTNNYCRNRLVNWANKPMGYYQQAKKKHVPNIDKKISELENNQKSKIKRYKFLRNIFIALFIVCGLTAVGSYYIVDSLKEHVKESKITQSAHPQSKDSIMDNYQRNNSKYDASNAKSQLSINGISLDDSWDSVKRQLGTPKKTNAEGNLTRYTFDDLEVVVNQSNKVEALVSVSNNAETKGGISVGDPESAVLARYGNDYSKSEYNNDVLYEYSYDTPSGKPALLRFAVNKDTRKVSYISARTLSGDVLNARNAFLAFHRNISNKNYQGAYNTFSPDMQKAMGSYSSFAQGYQNTISSSVKNLHIMSVSPSSVTFAYILEAEDRDGSYTKTQQFNGQVTMIQDNGQWKIGDMAAQKR